MLLPISPNILVRQGNILGMPLALGQVFIFGRRDCFCQTQNSSNYSLFEWFCYYDLGQILANMDFHAHTWPRIESTNFFILQKNFPNVNVSIWPIYKVMNVHWLKSMKYYLKMEFWVHLSSWKMKTFWCFLAKCWPTDAFLMLSNIENLSEMVFECFLIPRTITRMCFGQDLAKKHQISS